MRIGILCNSKLCLPGLYFLAQQGVSLAIVLPEQQHEDHLEIEQFAGFSAIPTQRWSKKEVNDNLHSWVAMNQLDTVWVMTFPYILSKQAIERTSVPLLNFHFAPLPKYKGAQPVFWMLKNGEKEGGISVHQITDRVDAGPMLHFEPYAIPSDETFGSYQVNIAQLNVTAIIAVFNKLRAPKWEQTLKKQKTSKVKECKTPGFADVQIVWQSMKSYEIEALCRACNPWNKGAISNLNGVMVKFLELSVVNGVNHKGEQTGTVVFLEEEKSLVISTLDKKYLKIGLVFLDQGFYRGNRKNLHGLRDGMVLT